MALQDEKVTAPAETIAVDLGLSIDMLDVDRLREWALLLLIHGADIGHWGSVSHVAGKMQMIATSIERAIRDIGALRSLLATERARADAAERERDRLREALTWAERQLQALVTDDDGTGAFIRHTGTELVGFGAGMKNIRCALSAEATKEGRT